MLAGKTNTDVGTRVRITKVSDKDDQDMVGMTGTITHPFPGLMVGSASKYIAGVNVDEESAAGKLTRGPLGSYTLNLVNGDEYEVI